MTVASELSDATVLHAAISEGGMWAEITNYEWYCLIWKACAAIAAHQQVPTSLIMIMLLPAKGCADSPTTPSAKAITAIQSASRIFSRFRLKGLEVGV
jgi:hypothetical protein